MEKVDFLKARQLIKDGMRIVSQSGKTGEDTFTRSYWIKDDVLYKEFTRTGPTCVVMHDVETYKEDIDEKINNFIREPENNQNQLGYCAYSIKRQLGK